MITLKTLSSATAQEVFDQVAQHLLTQNESSEAKGDCLYRGPNGLKCAAGCLISDHEYASLELEDTPWEMLVSNNIVPDAHRKLIKHLQWLHDDNPPCDWYGELKRVADLFSLDCSVLLRPENRRDIHPVCNEH